jgi:microcin C transport system substrate-binding protein
MDRAAPWCLAATLAMAMAAGLPARAEEKIISSHGISTFGDLQLPADFAHLPYVNPEAPKGGEISEGTFGGFDSMNPYSVKGRAAVGSNIMLETILTGVADEIGASYCLMCTTMDYPEDRSWVVFHLRDDVKFSDGTPLTAEDVVFSFEPSAPRACPISAPCSTKIESAEVLDPLTREVHLQARRADARPAATGRRPAGHFQGALPEEQARSGGKQPDALPGLGRLMCRTAIGRPTGRSTYAATPITGARICRSDRPEQPGPHPRFEYFDDDERRLRGVQGRRLHLPQRKLVAELGRRVTIFPAATDGTIKQGDPAVGNKASGQAFLFNLRREKWQDPRVREAIGLMFNFEWSNQTLFYGLYQRINSVWENTDMEATGAPSPARGGDPAAAGGRGAAARLDPDR